jgi:hypothetical protein
MSMADEDNNTLDEEVEEHADCSDAHPDESDLDAAGEDENTSAGRLSSSAWNDDDEGDDQSFLQDFGRGVREENMATIGVLTLHTEARDVRVVIDGDAGMRAIAVFLGRHEHADKHHLATASARRGWVGFDLDRLVAISWVPGVPKNDSRFAIDPIPA